MTTGRKAKWMGAAVVLAAALMLVGPPATLAQEDVGDLKEQMKLLQEQMKQLHEKIENIEENEEEIDELADRVSKTEMHTATDKVSFSIDFRNRVDSIHYSDIRMAPDQFIDAFFMPVAQGGFNGATGQQVQDMMGSMQQNDMIPDAEKRDADNDKAFTTKLHLDMKARVNNHLDFGGRLAVYKVWGDSTGVKFNNGSLGDVTLDGNTTSLPHGDTVRLERAYFNLHGDVGPVPMNFSLGRRPSTNGPPLEFRNFSLEGGSPVAHIINWQFDGASLNFGLEDVTGIPGAAFKLCYGVGFEGEWGNSFSLSANPRVDDVDLLGFIATLYDNGLYSAVFNYAHASGISDGFTGLTVMPFIVSKDDAGRYNFSPNQGGFISRLEPSTELGDWDAATLLLRANTYELFEKDIDFFLSGAWSHTDPDRISENPFYELLGQGLLSSNGDLESHDGYSIYAGARFPMPFDGKLGLEYNWGSQYWFNFTGAEDSLVGSKLAVRGSVYESYYIQPIFGRNFFVKLGGQYYDYRYTGSGNPLGEPVDIDDVTALDSLNAVIDDVWVGYVSATLRF